MAKETYITEGVVAFSNLTEHELFKGKSTGRYSVVITLEPEAASKLGQMGIKVKDYKGTPQRKFSSTYTVNVMDADKSPVSGEIPFGSKVRLLWTTGNVHPEHGAPTYLTAVKVLEFADSAVPEEF